MALLDQLAAVQEVLSLDDYQLATILGLPQSLLKYPELEPLLNLGLVVRKRHADQLVELANLLYSEFPNHGQRWLLQPNPWLKEQHLNCPPYRALITMGVGPVLRAAYIDYDQIIVTRPALIPPDPSWYAGG